MREPDPAARAAAGLRRQPRERCASRSAGSSIRTTPWRAVDAGRRSDRTQLRARARRAALDARHGASAIAERVAGQRRARRACSRTPSWDEIERVTAARRPRARAAPRRRDRGRTSRCSTCPVIKAIRGADREAAEHYPGTLLLLDHPTEGGGRGKAWNWSDAARADRERLRRDPRRRARPRQRRQALGELGDLLPWGVDVATGVEGDGAPQGRREASRAFVAAVRTRSGTKARRLSGRRPAGRDARPLRRLRRPLRARDADRRARRARAEAYPRIVGERAVPAPSSTALLADYAGRPTPLYLATPHDRGARRRAHLPEARGPRAHRRAQDQQRARPGACSRSTWASGA